jgi:signal transduction histidine kinase
MFDLARLPRSELLAALEANLQRRTIPEKLYRHFLKAVRLYLDADATCLINGLRSNGDFGKSYNSGDRSLFDDKLVRDFVAQRSPALPHNLLLAPLRVRGYLTGVVGAARKESGFARGTGRDLNRLCALLAKELTRRHEVRLDRVLDRIKEKVVQELRPRDLAYQILGGLHELVDYDHSAALLELDQATGVLRVQAEKIVWTKGKSAFIGHEIPLNDEVLDYLQQCNEPSVLCGDGQSPDSQGERLLRDLLAYHRGHGLPAASSLISAPMLFKGELLGLLKIAGWRRTSFDRRDLEVVTRFLPVAAIALRNARVTVSLEDQVLDAELRAGLVTLARAVAHDVNNAIGAILPLAEQMREEVAEGTADPQDLVEDLNTIVDKTRLCRRIFGNMLRTGVRRSGTGPFHLNQLVREMLPMLEAQVGDRSIELCTDLASDLPLISCSKTELEHVVWNLLTNSIDAIGSARGSIWITTSPLNGTGQARPRGVRLQVRDNGPGIDPEMLAKVQEPFFTTKHDGTGLGLPICRSLVWQLGGRLQVASTPGSGTEVTVELPVAESQPEAHHDA